MKRSLVANLKDRRWTRLALGALLVALLAGTLVLGTLTFAAPAQAASAPAITYSEQELAFVRILNEFRASLGLKPLLISDRISEAARRHSSDMAKYNFFSHYTEASDWFPKGASPWARMAASGYDYNTYKGENIAAGFRTAEAVFEGWKNSPGHYANMVNPNYTVIGIGLVEVPGTKYVWYWTTDFGGVVDPSARKLEDLTAAVTQQTQGSQPVSGGSASAPSESTPSGQGAPSAPSKPSTPSAPGTSFTDVTDDMPYAAAIKLLAAKGVIQGYLDGRFGPNDPVTRQQFAKMIVLALGIGAQPLQQACPFSDVQPLPTSSDPLYPTAYVAACAAAGIVVGKTQDRFYPYEHVTRAQLISMIARAADLPEPPADYQPVFGPFSPDHYPWARRAAYAGLLDGLVGMARDYNFWAMATRGEVCQLLANLISR